MFEQTYTQVADKSVERLLKRGNRGPQSNKNRKTKNSQKPWKQSISEVHLPSLLTLIHNLDKSVNKPVQTEENYRLTEDNWSTIDPMIGLSEDDIAAFWPITKKTSGNLNKT